MMQEPFIIPPEWDEKRDKERIAYAQDVFLDTVLGGGPPSLCAGPVETGICAWCGAQTSLTPHADSHEVLHVSSRPEVFPDLMRIILRDWPLQDLRMLGKILRVEDSLLIAQDVIHVYQKQNPLDIAHEHEAIGERSSWEVHHDLIRTLARDVYFVPIKYDWLFRAYQPETERYKAQSFIGRVVAYLQLSPKALRASNWTYGPQWVVFSQEQVQVPFAEHPEWRQGWHETWKAYMQAIKKIEEDEA